MCFDESVQLTSETRHPLPARRANRPAMTLNINGKVPPICFYLCNRLRGWRQVNVTHQRINATLPSKCGSWWMSTSPRRNGSGWSWTTSTPTPAALYGVFPPDEAHRIIRKLGVSLHSQAWELAQYGGV